MVHYNLMMTQNEALSFLLFCAIVLVSGCEILPPGRTMTTCESYYLTPQERSSLENKAIKNSDASAAYDLAFYYEASAFDEVRAYKWFSIAKKLGDKRAASWINALKERQRGQ